MLQYYECDFGLIPVFVGDDIFNALSSLANGIIADVNGPYPLGTQLAGIIDTSVKIPIAIRQNDANSYKELTFRVFSNFFPSSYLVPVEIQSVATTTVSVYSMEEDTNKIARTSVRVDSWNLDHSFNFISSLRTLIPDDYYTSTNGVIPFGAFQPASTGGNQPDYIGAGFFCCTTDMTQWIAEEFMCDGYGSTSAAPLSISRMICTPSQNAFLANFFKYLPPYVPPTGEPYEEIDPATTGGGDGTYNFQDSDPIDFPTLPQLSAVATGFVSLWSPTEQQMLDLSSFMWNADITTIDFWKKLFADPKDLIFGLSLVPLNLADLGYIDGQGTVVVGLVNTRIMMDKVSSQWVEFDCGTLDIDEAWGAYLDYDPYTKLEIYLPFCGVHPIKVDDFTPGTISLKYYIDLLSGTCVAMVKSTKSNKHGDVLDSVMYQFMGNCAAQIPVSSQQFADAVRSAISIAASIGTMVATGVGGAAAMTAAKSAGAGLATAMRTVSSEISTGASAVENVMNIKPAIERSGAIGSTAALLGVRTPYIILTRPRMARPDSQSTYTGYPSFITETLGDISGWTIVQAIHLEAIPCTSEEMSEIDELLKGGVIF